MRSSSGTPEWNASIAAGSRLATAVPEVQITAAGTPVSRPMPSAVNPATRSSMRTHAERALIGEAHRGERERLRTGPRREHHVAHSVRDEIGEQRCRGIGCRR